MICGVFGWPMPVKIDTELMTNKEAIRLLTQSAATIKCLVKALRDLNWKESANLINEAGDDILRVAAVLQAAKDEVKSTKKEKSK